MPVAGKGFRIFKPNFIHIDEPPDLEIGREVRPVHGWFICENGKRRPSLRAGNLELAWLEVQRPDVSRILGGAECYGFRTVIDLNRILTAETLFNRILPLDLVVEEKRVASAQLHLGADVDVRPQIAMAIRQRKRGWLRDNVCCPICRAEVEFDERKISCRSCGRQFENGDNILDFLPSDLKHNFQIDDWTDISAHDYDDVASSILAEVKSSGGKILDCGCGARATEDESVICLDVAAFPTVDLLAINQRLPFRDATFDAAFSLNVLEHVTDPFNCAAELVRVLKPGGKLYCCVPFLQPEHGFPHHYFNATRSGLRQLFPKDIELQRQFVPGSGQPVWTLHWFLTWYARELPEADRRNFLDMRLRDVIDRPALALLQEPWVTRLSDKGNWTLASTTAAIFRKQ